MSRARYEASKTKSAEYIACAYLIIWGTDFTINARDCFGGEDEAKVEITLDAYRA